MSAASLYLSLSALGLSLTVEVAPEHADGHTIKVRGLGLMDSDDRERIRRLIRANKAELVALLTSGLPIALAVRQEACCGSNTRSQEEAA